MSFFIKTPHIKAIAFDWGGVLIEDPAPGFLKLLSVRFQCSQEELTLHLSASMHDFQRGFVSEEHFLSSLAKKLNRPNAKRPFWKEALREVYREHNVVHDLARFLRKKGYFIGLITNTEMPARDFHLECNYDFFDARIFSCEEGVAKPEKRIYELMAKRLGVTNNELIIIDDKRENIEGAINAGAFGILYKNPQQLANELEIYGIPKFDYPRYQQYL